MNRTERFYRIDQLLHERRVVPLKAFLDTLDISRATFKRDMEYLRDRLNAPIIWDCDAGGDPINWSCHQSKIVGISGNLDTDFVVHRNALPDCFRIVIAVMLAPVVLGVAVNAALALIGGVVVPGLLMLGVAGVIAWLAVFPSLD